MKTLLIKGGQIVEAKSNNNECYVTLRLTHEEDAIKFFKKTGLSFTNLKINLLT